MGFQVFLLAALLIGLVGLFTGFLIACRRKQKTRTLIHSCLDSFRSLGKLLVFKIISKEIVTVEENAFEGMMGKILPDWIFTRKRIIMIFEFSMNFTYDLRDPGFSISSEPEHGFTVTMPVPSCDVALKDLSFYDEQKSKFLPIFFPDIINGPLGRSFSVEEKNRLFSEAMKMVSNNAHDLLIKYQEDVRASARNTLEGIARSFGAEKIRIVFTEAEVNMDTRLNGNAA